MALANSPSNSVPPYCVLGVCGIVGLLGVLFYPTLLQLAAVWDKDPNYAHGYLILPVSLFLAWRAWRDNPVPGEGELFLGGLTLGVGLLIHCLWVLIEWPPLDFVAMVLVLRGLTVLVGGRQWARGYLFPILFLFFMFPVPYSWTMNAALWLQDWVTVAATHVLKLFIDCDYSGNTIILYDSLERLNIAEECSGLRQIVAFLALGALVGHFSGQGAGVRLLLLGAAVPIAFLANVVRVLLMTLILCLFGREWISGWMHEVLGILPIPLGLALFFFVVRMLGQWFPAREASS